MPPSGVGVANTGDLAKLIDDYTAKGGDPPGTLIVNPDVLDIMKRAHSTVDLADPVGFKVTEWHGIPVALSDDLPPGHVYALRSPVDGKAVDYLAHDGKYLLPLAYGGYPRRGYDHISIMNVSSGYRAEPPSTRRAQLQEALNTVLRCYGLVLMETDEGRALHWAANRDEYMAVMTSPALVARGLEWRVKVRVTAQSLHSMTRPEYKHVLAETIEDAAKSYWPGVSAWFTGGCFPCHDGPAPGTPAELYERAFG